MRVSQNEFIEIVRYRNVFLKTPDGRRTLCDMLHSLGLLREADEMQDAIAKDPAVSHDILTAIGLLQKMAVWNYDTFHLLIEKMADLPLPEVEGAP